MSYFDGPNKGYGWAAGHFLVSDEKCIRKSMTIPANHSQAVTRDDGRKVVPAGAVIPANDATAKGILYEDIDVTEGAKMGSIVTEGTVYGDRLPEALSEDTTEGGETVPGAATALDGIHVIPTSPAITRPYVKEA
jgi:hypothetical protein